MRSSFCKYERERFKDDSQCLIESSFFFDLFQRLDKAG